MKRLLMLPALMLSGAAFATDHNNIEKDRPLRFDDAYSIAYRSLEFQNGFRLDTFNRARPVYNFRSELQYGFAKNKDISLGFEPSYNAADGKTRLNIAELSYFEGLRREIGNQPALGYRVDVGLPVDGTRRGVETRFRGVLTKSLHQYDKIHLNFDVNYSSAPNSGERSTTLGAILGYSSPVGYPRHFNTTMLAEFGVEQSKLDAGGVNSWVGIGMRKQVSTTAVIDFGLQSDVFSAKGNTRSPVRLTLGYSFNF